MSLHSLNNMYDCYFLKCPIACLCTTANINRLTSEFIFLTDIQDDDTLAKTVPSTTYSQTLSHSTEYEDSMPASTVTSFYPLSIEPQSNDITESTVDEINISKIEKKDIILKTKNKSKKVETTRIIDETIEDDTEGVLQEMMVGSGNIVKDSVSLNERKRNKNEIEFSVNNRHETKVQSKIEQIDSEDTLIEEIFSDNISVQKCRKNIEEESVEELKPLETTNEILCSAHISEELRHRPSISETLTFYGPKEDDILNKRSILVVEEDTSTDYENETSTPEVGTKERDAGRKITRTGTKDTKRTQKISKQIQFTEHADDTLSYLTNEVEPLQLTHTVSPLDLEVNLEEATVSFEPNKHLSIETHDTHETSGNVHHENYQKIILIPDIVPSLATKVTEINTNESLESARNKIVDIQENATFTSIVSDKAIEVEEISLIEQTVDLKRNIMGKETNLNSNIISNEATIGEEVSVYDTEGEFTGLKSIETNAKASMDEIRPLVQSSISCLEQTNEISKYIKIEEKAKVDNFQKQMNSLIITESSQTESTEALHHKSSDHKEATKIDSLNRGLTVEQLTVHETPTRLKTEDMPKENVVTTKLESSECLLVTDVSTCEVSSKIPDYNGAEVKAASNIHSQQSVMVTDTNVKETVYPSTDIKYRSEQAITKYSSDIPLMVSEIITDEKESILSPIKMNEINLSTDIITNFPLQTKETVCTDSSETYTAQAMSSTSAKRIYPQYEAIYGYEQVLGEKECYLQEDTVRKSNAEEKSSSELYSIITQEIVADETQKDLRIVKEKVAEATVIQNIQEPVKITTQSPHESTSDFTSDEPKKMTALPGVNQQESVIVLEVQVEDKEYQLLQKNPILVQADIKQYVRESITVNNMECMDKEGVPAASILKPVKADMKHAGAVQSLSIQETTVLHSLDGMADMKNVSELSSVSFEENCAAEVKEIVISEHGSNAKIKTEKADLATILETALVSDHIIIEEISLHEKTDELFTNSIQKWEEATKTILPQEGIVVSEVIDSGNGEHFEPNLFNVSNAKDTIVPLIAVEIENPIIQESIASDKNELFPITKAKSIINEFVALNVSEVNIKELPGQVMNKTPHQEFAASKVDQQMAVSVMETEQVFPVDEFTSPSVKIGQASPATNKNDSISVHIVSTNEKENTFVNMELDEHIGKKVTDLQEALLIKEYQELSSSGNVSEIRPKSEIANKNIVPQKAIVIHELTSNDKEDTFMSKKLPDVKIQGIIEINESVLEINEIRAQSPIHDYVKKQCKTNEVATAEYIEQKSLSVSVVSTSEREKNFSNKPTAEYKAKVEHMPGYHSVIVSEEYQNQNAQEFQKFKGEESIANVNLKGLTTAGVSEIIPQEFEGIYKQEPILELYPIKKLEGENIPLMTEELYIPLPFVDIPNTDIIKEEKIIPEFSSHKALIVEETSVQELESYLKPEISPKISATVGLSNECEHVNVSQIDSVESSEELKLQPYPSNRSANVKLTEPNKVALTSSVILNEKEDTEAPLITEQQSAKRAMDIEESISIYELEAQSPLPELEIQLPKTEASCVSYIPSVASSVSQVTINEREIDQGIEKLPTISLKPQMVPGNTSLQVEETLTQDSIGNLIQDKPFLSSAKVGVFPKNAALQSDVICGESENTYIPEKPTTDSATIELEAERVPIQITENHSESSLGVFKGVISVMGQAIQNIIPKKAIEIYSTLTSEREGKVILAIPQKESVSLAISGTHSSVGISEVTIEDKEGILVLHDMNTELATSVVIPFQAALTEETVTQDKECHETFSQPRSVVPKESQTPASEPIIVSEVIAESNVEQRNEKMAKTCETVTNIVSEDSYQVEFIQVHEKEREFRENETPKSELNITNINNEPSHVVALSSNTNTLESLNVLDLTMRGEEKIASILLTGQHVAEVTEQITQDLEKNMEIDIHKYSSAKPILDEKQPIYVSEIEPDLREQAYVCEEKPDTKKLDANPVIIPMYLPNVIHTETSELEGFTCDYVCPTERANIGITCKTVAQTIERNLLDTSKDFKDDFVKSSNASVNINEVMPLSVIEINSETKECQYNPKDVDTVKLQSQPVIVPRITANVSDVTLNDQVGNSSFTMDREYTANLVFNEQAAANTIETCVHERESHLNIDSSDMRRANPIFDENQCLSISEVISDIKEGRYNEMAIPQSQQSDIGTVVVPRHIANVYETDLKEHETATPADVYITSKAIVSLKGQDVVLIHQPITREKEENFDSTMNIFSTARLEVEEMQSVKVSEIVLDSKEGIHVSDKLPQVCNVKTNPVVVPLYLANVSEHILREQEGLVKSDKTEENSASVSFVTNVPIELTETMVNSKEKPFKVVPDLSITASTTIDSIHPISVSEVSVDMKEGYLKLQRLPVEESISEQTIISPLYVPKVMETNVTEQEENYIVENNKEVVAQVKLFEQHAAAIEETMFNETENKMKVPLDIGKTATQLLGEQHHISVSEVHAELKELDASKSEHPDTHKVNTSQVIEPRHVPSIEFNQTSEHEGPVTLNTELMARATSTFDVQSSMVVTHTQAAESERTLPIPISNEDRAKLSVNEMHSIDVTEIEPNQKEEDYVSMDIMSKNKSIAKPEAVINPLRAASVDVISIHESEININIKHPVERNVKVAMDGQTVAQITKPQLHDFEEKFESEKQNEIKSRCIMEEKRPLTITEIHTGTSEGTYRTIKPDELSLRSETVIVPLIAARTNETMIACQGRAIESDKVQHQRARLTMDEHHEIETTESMIIEKEKSYSNNSDLSMTVSVDILQSHPLTVTEVCIGNDSVEYSKQEKPKSQTVEINTVFTPRYVAGIDTTQPEEAEGTVDILNFLKANATTTISGQIVPQITQPLIRDKENTLAISKEKSMEALMTLEELKHLVITEVDVASKENNCELQLTPMSHKASSKHVLIPLAVPNIHQEELAEKEGLAQVTENLISRAMVSMFDQQAAEVSMPITAEKESSLKISLDKPSRAIQSLSEMHSLVISEQVIGNKEEMYRVKELPSNQTALVSRVIKPMQIANISLNVTAECEEVKENMHEIGKTACISITSQLAPQVTEPFKHEKELSLVLPSNREEIAKSLLDEMQSIIVNETTPSFNEATLQTKNHPTEQKIIKQNVFSPRCIANVSETEFSEKESTDMRQLPVACSARITFNEQEATQVSQNIFVDKESVFKENSTSEIENLPTNIVFAPRHVPNVLETVTSEKGNETIFDAPISGSAKISFNEKIVPQVSVEFPNERESKLLSGVIPDKQTVLQDLIISPRYLPNVEEAITSEQAHDEVYDKLEYGKATVGLSKQAVLEITQPFTGYKEKIFNAIETPAVQQISEERVFSPRHVPSIDEPCISERGDESGFDKPIYEKAKLLVSEKNVASIIQPFSAEKEGKFEQEQIQVSHSLSEQIVISPRLLPNVEETVVSELGNEESFSNPIPGKATIAVNEQQATQITEPLPADKEVFFGVIPLPEQQNVSEQLVMTPCHLPNVAETITSEQSSEKQFEIPLTGKAIISLNEQAAAAVIQPFSGVKEEQFVALEIPSTQRISEQIVIDARHLPNIEETFISEHGNETKIFKPNMGIATISVDEQVMVEVTQPFLADKEGEFSASKSPVAINLSEQLVLAPRNVPNIEETVISEQGNHGEYGTANSAKAVLSIDKKSVAQVSQTFTDDKEIIFSAEEVPRAHRVTKQVVIEPRHLPDTQETLVSEHEKDEKFNTPDSAKAIVSINEQSVVQVSETVTDDKEINFSAGEIPGSQRVTKQVVIEPRHLPDTQEILVSEHEKQETFKTPNSAKAILSIDEKSVVQVLETITDDKETHFSAREIPEARKVTRQVVIEPRHLPDTQETLVSEHENQLAIPTPNLAKAILSIDEKSVVQVLETVTDDRESNFLPGEIPGAQKVTKQVVIEARHLPDTLETLVSEHENQLAFTTPNSAKAIISIDEKSVVQVSETFTDDKETIFSPGEIPGVQKLNRQVVIEPRYLPGTQETLVSEHEKQETFNAPNSAKAILSIDEKSVVQVMETVTDDRETSFLPGEIPGAQKGTKQVVIEPRHLPDTQETLVSEHENQLAFTTPNSAKAIISIDEKSVVQVSETFTDDKETIFSPGEIPGAQKIYRQVVIEPRHLPDIQETLASEHEKQQTFNTHNLAKAILSIDEKSVVQVSEIVTDDKEISFSAGEIPGAQKLTKQVVIEPRHLPDTQETFVSEHEKLETFNIPHSAKAIISIDEKSVVEVSETVTDDKEIIFSAGEIPGAQRLTEQVVVEPRHLPDTLETLISEHEKQLASTTPNSVKAIVAIDEKSVLQVSETFTVDKESNFLAGEIPGAQKITGQVVIEPRHLPDTQETFVSEHEKQASFKTPNSAKAILSIDEKSVVQVSETVTDDKEISFSVGEIPGAQKVTKQVVFEPRHLPDTLVTFVSEHEKRLDFTTPNAASAILSMDGKSVVQISETFTDDKESDLLAGEILGKQRVTKQVVIEPRYLPDTHEPLISKHEKLETLKTPNSAKAILSVDEKSVIQVSETVVNDKEICFSAGEIPGPQKINAQIVVEPRHLPDTVETLVSEHEKQLTITKPLAANVDKISSQKTEPAIEIYSAFQAQPDECIGILQDLVNPVSADISSVEDHHSANIHEIQVQDGKLPMKKLLKKRKEDKREANIDIIDEKPSQILLTEINKQEEKEKLVDIIQENSKVKISLVKEENVEEFHREESVTKDESLTSDTPKLIENVEVGILLERKHSSDVIHPILFETSDIDCIAPKTHIVVAKPVIISREICDISNVEINESENFIPDIASPVTNADVAISTSDHAQVIETGLIYSLGDVSHEVNEVAKGIVVLDQSSHLTSSKRFPCERVTDLKISSQPHTTKAIPTVDECQTLSVSHVETFDQTGKIEDIPVPHIVKAQQSQSAQEHITVSEIQLHETSTPTTTENSIEVLAIPTTILNPKETVSTSNIIIQESCDITVPTKVIHEVAKSITPSNDHILISETKVHETFEENKLMLPELELAVTSITELEPIIVTQIPDIELVGDLRMIKPITDAALSVLNLSQPVDISEVILQDVAVDLPQPILKPEKLKLKPSEAVSLSQVEVSEKELNFEITSLPEEKLKANKVFSPHQSVIINESEIGEISTDIIQNLPQRATATSVIPIPESSCVPNITVKESAVASAKQHPKVENNIVSTPVSETDTQGIAEMTDEIIPQIQPERIAEMATVSITEELQLAEQEDVLVLKAPKKEKPLIEVIEEEPDELEQLVLPLPLEIPLEKSENIISEIVEKPKKKTKKVTESKMKKSTEIVVKPQKPEQIMKSAELPSETEEIKEVTEPLEKDTKPNDVKTPLKKKESDVHEDIQQELLPVPVFTTKETPNELIEPEATNRIPNVTKSFVIHEDLKESVITEKDARPEESVIEVTKGNDVPISEVNIPKPCENIIASTKEKTAIQQVSEVVPEEIKDFKSEHLPKSANIHIQEDENITVATISQTKLQNIFAIENLPQNHKPEKTQESAELNEEKPEESVDIKLIKSKEHLDDVEPEFSVVELKEPEPTNFNETITLSLQNEPIINKTYEEVHEEFDIQSSKPDTATEEITEDVKITKKKTKKKYSTQDEDIAKNVILKGEEPIQDVVIIDEIRETMLNVEEKSLHNSETDTKTERLETPDELQTVDLKLKPKMKKLVMADDEEAKCSPNPKEVTEERVTVTTKEEPIIDREINENVEIKSKKPVKKHSVSKGPDIDSALEKIPETMENIQKENSISSEKSPEEEKTETPDESLSVNIKRKVKSKKQLITNEEESQITISKPRHAETETQSFDETVTLKTKNKPKVEENYQEMTEILDIQTSVPSDFTTEEITENVKVKPEKSVKKHTVSENTVSEKITVTSKEPDIEATSEEAPDILKSIEKQRSISSEKSPEKEKTETPDEILSVNIKRKVKPKKEFITNKEESQITISKPNIDEAETQPFNETVILKTKDIPEIGDNYQDVKETLEIQTIIPSDFTTEEITENIKLKPKKLHKKLFSAEDTVSEKIMVSSEEPETEATIEEAPKTMSNNEKQSFVESRESPENEKTETYDESFSVSIKRKTKPKKVLVSNEEESKITLSKPHVHEIEAKPFDETVIIKTKDKPDIAKKYHEIQETIDIQSSKPTEFTTEETTEDVKIKMKKVPKKYSIQEENITEKVTVISEDSDQGIKTSNTDLEKTAHKEETVIEELDHEISEEMESVNIKRKKKPKRSIISSEEECEFTISTPTKTTVETAKFDETVILTTPNEPTINKEYHEIEESIEIQCNQPSDFTSEESTENVSIKMKKAPKKYSVQEDDVVGEIMLKADEPEEDIIYVEENTDILIRETVSKPKTILKKKTKTGKSIKPKAEKSPSPESPAESYEFRTKKAKKPYSIENEDMQVDFHMGKENLDTIEPETINLKQNDTSSDEDKTEEIEEVDGEFTFVNKPKQVPRKTSEVISSAEVKLPTLPHHPPVCVSG